MRNATAVAMVVMLTVSVAGATSLYDMMQVAGSDGAAGDRAVLNSFPSPGDKPMGLLYSEASYPGAGDECIFHVDEAKGDVYMVSPDGTATLWFNILEQTGHPNSQDCGNGICEYPAAMAGHFYITDMNGHEDEPGVDRVYLFDFFGYFLHSWDVSAIADGVIGITTRYGSTFWLTTAGGEVVECDDDFQELARYSIPGYSGGGIDYDEDTGRLYLIDWVTGDIRVCDTAMNVLTTFDGHPTATNMVGVTVGETARGRSVWTSTYGCTGPYIEPSIFEIEDEYYDPNPVEDSSWGSIKALYR